MSSGSSAKARLLEVQENHALTVQGGTTAAIIGGCFRGLRRECGSRIVVGSRPAYCLLPEAQVA